jgi:hypothetical protein
MQRFFQYLMLGLGVLLVAYVGFVAVVRLRGPSAEQRAALELMRQPTPPVRGKDGSDALWLLSHDVPAANASEAARQLRDYHERFNALMNEGQVAAANALTNPLSAYREFPKPAGNAHLCELNEPGCLAKVGADLEAVQRELEPFQGAIAAANEMLRHDGLRWNRRPGVYQALPAYNTHRSVVFSQLAWRFASGEQQPAMAATCDDIAAWRRLGSDNDMLIGSMVGAAYLRQDLGLLAEMLAEMPADTDLPPNCREALAPTQDKELDLCPALRSEFRVLEATLADGAMVGKSLPERIGFQTIHQEHLLSISAVQLARYCAASALRTAKQDRAVVAGPDSGHGCTGVWRSADPIGCLFAEMASSQGMANYVNRRTDLAAALALMRTVLWLRVQSPDPTSWPGLLRQRPAALGLRRQPTINADASRITIPLLDPSRDAEFSLALQTAGLSAASSATTD